MTNKLNNVIEYLKEDVDVLKDVVNQLNSYDSSFDHLAVMENNEEFFDIYFPNNPAEAVRSALYGDYRYTDDYVRFNGYRNLESLTEWELQQELLSEVDEIADLLITRYETGDVYVWDEALKAILDSDDEEEDEEE